MNRLLERLGGGAVRWRWAVIIAWVIILGGLLGARHAFGGDFVNNYAVSGTDSARGLDTLNASFPQQGGYGGQTASATEQQHENSGFARWGRMVSARPWPWASPRSRCWPSSRSRCSPSCSASLTTAQIRRPTATSAPSC